MVMSVSSKPVSGSLKMAAKLIGLLNAGSVWPAARLIVTVRPVVSITVAVKVARALPGAGATVALDAAAVFESTVTFATFASTCTLRVKMALPTDIFAILQETVPPAPTAGVVQLQPPGDANDTNVVPRGKVSDK